MTAHIMTAVPAASDIDAIPAEMFERVIRALNVAYYDWMPGSDVIRASAALTDMLGFDANSWTVQRHWERIHPDDVSGYRATLAAAFKNGAERVQVTYRMRRPGGEYRWVVDHGLVERNARGRVVRLTGAVSDITEAKEREAQNRTLIAGQAVSIEVLQTISASPDDAQPIFDLIVRHARELCDARTVTVVEYDGTLMHVRAVAGFDPAATERFRQAFPRPPGQETVAGRVVRAGQVVQVKDMSTDAGIFQQERDLGAQSYFGVPLLRDGHVIGAIELGRLEPGGFGDAEAALVASFAEQALIAIANAKTLGELRARTEELAMRNSEYGERIEQQSATIDVLKVMAASPGDARPVFELIVERAQAFCDADSATVALLDGDILHLQAHTMTGIGALDYEAQFPRPVGTDSMFGRAILARDAVQTLDLSADTEHFTRTRIAGAAVGSIIAVPLLRSNEPIGAVALARTQSGGFSKTQMELLRTFAEQSVIAVGSADTYHELQTRTAELIRSVAELQALEEVLRAVNSSLDLDTVLATIISRAVQLSQADEGTIYEFDETEEVFVPKATFGMTAERVDALRERRIRMGETPLGNSAAVRAPLHIPDLTQALGMEGARELVDDGIHALLVVPLLREDRIVGGLVIRRRTAGGFAPTIPTLLQTFAGQSVLAIENANLFEEARRARNSAEAALTDLRHTQDRLVQSEKMASLGQLTAGIAHEIKNPLNFVNNFSDLSIDLLNELHEAVAPDKLTVATDLRAEIDDLTTTLRGNLAKIAQHGRRADSIVKNMLLHSRSEPSEYRAIDLNAIVEEALSLAYHGARAETPGFNIALNKDLDPDAGTVELYPQEFTRALLNLISNGFYAARNRAGQSADKDFEPTLRLSTRDLGEKVEVRVWDNGTGINNAVRDKIFEPFFTTKPAGEGTGLGLSLSYGIIVKQHSGQLNVDSQADAFTEFVITLPRKMPAGNGRRP